MEHNYSLLIKKFDVDTHLFNTAIEKHFDTLPSNLRFVKKFLYFQFFPKLFEHIDKLESFRFNPSFDRDVPSINPSSSSEIQFRPSCISSFKNAISSGKKVNEFAVGTRDGTLFIFDCFSTKPIVSTKISSSRIDLINTAYFKNKDNSTSRISLFCRDSVNIHIYLYQHSSRILEKETSIEVGKLDPIGILNSHYPIDLKLSKDGLFLGVTFLDSSVKLYKFTKEPCLKDEGLPNYRAPILLHELSVPKQENEVLVKVEVVEKKDKKKEKPKTKESKIDVDLTGRYITKSIIDNENDETAITVRPDVLARLTFVDKVHFNEGDDRGSLLTNGLYVTFLNTGYLHYINLEADSKPFIPVFCVTKVVHPKVELFDDGMTIASTRSRREKEFTNYIHGKLDNLVIPPKTEYTENISGKNVPFTFLYPITAVTYHTFPKEDRNLIAFGFNQGSIVVWNTALLSELAVLQITTEEISALALDEHFLIAGQRDGQVLIFNLASKNCTYKGYNFPYKNFACIDIFIVHPLIACVMDVDGNRTVYFLKEGRKLAVFSSQEGKLAFGNSLLSATTDGYTIKRTHRRFRRAVKFR